MIQLIKNNRIFFLLFLLWTVAGAVVITLIPKGTIELWVNGHHAPGWDHFFLIMTYLGDGILAAAFFIILFLFVSRYKAIVYTITLVLSSLLVQILKRYANVPRPVKFFEYVKDVYYVEGLDIHSSYSFPSGHSAQAFSIFLVTALFVKNKNWAILFFILSVLTAFSRVYLMQHFVIDIYVGSLFGVVFSFILYYLLQEKTDWQKWDSPLIRKKL